MRILVIGAGAIGGYYGACLTRARRDVTFLVRSERAARLVQDGLRVISPDGDFTAPATTMLANTLGAPFDVVLVGVKSYGLDDAMSQFAPAVGAETMVLPILNGMAHLDSLGARFGTARVLGGAAQMGATLDPEGRIVHHFARNGLCFGEISGGISDRVRALASLLGVPGITVQASENIMQDMWEKWVQLGTGASMTCMMRGTIGDILAAPGGRETILSLFRECCEIATAAGYPPRPAFIEFDTNLFTTVGSPLKSSMLRDIERGSITEGEHILGELVARARALGVATPILDVARTHVATYEAGRAREKAAA